MLISIILLIIGFIILIKGSDMFIDGASSVATHFKLSKILIGLTIYFINNIEYYHTYYMFL